MLDPGDGNSDSERKGKDGLSLKGGECYLPTSFAVLRDLLLIWGPNLEYSGDLPRFIQDSGYY